MSEEGWVDRGGAWIEPSELSARDEILARLRGYHYGDLQAFLWLPARWEQDLHPLVLPPEDQQLARELLALEPSRAVVEQALRGVDVERAQAVLRQVVLEWSVPQQVQEELRLYLPRHQGEVTWLLEELRMGVTGLQVTVSISGPLPPETPYRVFSPAEHPEEPKRLEPWWDIFRPLRLSDDLGTRYAGRRSEGGGEFPSRIQTHRGTPGGVAQTVLQWRAVGRVLRLRPPLAGPSRRGATRPTSRVVGRGVLPVSDGKRVGTPRPELGLEKGARC